MKALLTLALLLSSHAFAYKIGDYVPNYCWSDHKGETVCFDDYVGQVKVLDFGSGWCGPCNTKMGQLASSVQKYKDKAVVFMSAVIDGWSKNVEADQRFMNEWKNRHNIPDMMPIVAVSRRDFYDIAGSGGIPRFAILDQDSKLVYQRSGPSISEIFQRVDKMLEESPELPPFLPWPPPLR